MITLNKVGGTDGYSAEFRCKSTDVENLPTEGVPNGSIAICIDEKKIYFFDMETKSWIEWV